MYNYNISATERQCLRRASNFCFVCNRITIRANKRSLISVKHVYLFVVDTPDPYVIVYIRDAPDGRKKTTHRDNETNPEWNEVLEYLLPSKIEGNKVIAEVDS